MVNAEVEAAGLVVHDGHVHSAGRCCSDGILQRLPCRVVDDAGRNTKRRVALGSAVAIQVDVRLTLRHCKHDGGRSSSRRCLDNREVGAHGRSCVVRHQHCHPLRSHIHCEPPDQVTDAWAAVNIGRTFVLAGHAEHGSATVVTVTLAYVGHGSHAYWESNRDTSCGAFTAHEATSNQQARQHLNAPPPKQRQGQQKTLW